LQVTDDLGEASIADYLLLDEMLEISKFFFSILRLNLDDEQMLPSRVRPEKMNGLRAIQLAYGDTDEEAMDTTEEEPMDTNADEIIENIMEYEYLLD